MFERDAPQAWLDGGDDDAPDGPSEPARPVGRGRHVVRQGECVHSIAHALGVPWRKLWDLSDNDALREADRKPSQLLPGDRLAVPEPTPGEVRLRTGRRHEIRAKIGLVEVTLSLRENGVPLANVAWRIEGDSVRREGTTDADGVLSTRLPSGLTRARLRLRVDEPTEVSHELVLGALDPLESTSGVQGRLANLGLYTGPVDGVLGPETRRALRSFQSLQGLRVHGGLDRETLDRLRDAHEG
jgi:hypothetical protein